MDRPATTSSKNTIANGDSFPLESLLEIEGGRDFAPDDNDGGDVVRFHHSHTMAPVSCDTASALSEYLS
jgi:hypothetical protein